MHLTRQSEYALLGLAVLADEPPGSIVSLARVAEVHRLPSTFLAKIFQKLARHGLLTSVRGPGRGYALVRDPASITLREILEAVEGPAVFQRCLLWPGHCADENPCPLHHRLQELVGEIESLLDRITLADYVVDSDHLRVHLSMAQGG